MGSYDPRLQELVGVDDVEVFIDDLSEYQFESPDPDENYTYHFYDMGGDNLPYTLQAVLEYYYRNKRAVRITVEDAGEARSAQFAHQNAERARTERQRALVALEAESRNRVRQQHQSKY